MFHPVSPRQCQSPHSFPPWDGWEPGTPPLRMGQGPGNAPKTQRIRTPVFSMSFWKSSLHLEDREAVIEVRQGFAQAGQSLTGLWLCPTLGGGSLSGQGHPLQDAGHVPWLRSIAEESKLLPQHVGPSEIHSRWPSCPHHSPSPSTPCLFPPAFPPGDTSFRAQLKCPLFLQPPESGHTPHFHTVFGVCFPHPTGSS